MQKTRIQKQNRAHKRSKELLINLAVLCAAVIVLFLILEIFFRVYLGNNLSYEYEGDLWLLEPDQQGFTCPNTKLSTINEHGFRGEYDPSKNSVLFLGDSFLFGYCLRDNETLLVHLASELREKHSCDIELINAGVPGYGIQNMIKLYNKRFSEYPSNYVVLEFVQEDMLRQSADDDPYFERKMFFRKMIRASSFISFMKPRLQVFRQLVTGFDKVYEEYFEVFWAKEQERIINFNAQLQAENKTLVLYLWRYKDHHDDFYERVKVFADEQGILMLEDHYHTVFGAYDGERKDLYAKEDDHPSEIQNRRIAASIADQFFSIVEDECHVKE